MTEPRITLENVSSDDITIMTELGSVCQLTRWHADLNFPLELGIVLKPGEVLFWFSRLKARVEGQGEGTVLMQRLVEILDCDRLAVLNGVNPYGAMTMQDLRRFYEKYGFVWVEEGTMFRSPR